MTSFPNRERTQDQLFKMLMKPLVRVFVRRGEPIQKFHTLAKQVFVEVAKDELLATEEKLTASRLSVLTGMARRDVKQVLEEKDEPLKSSVSIVARVMQQWEQDPRFCTKNKRPRTLSYEGPNSEFAELVASISSHVTPQTVLYELHRTGLVEETSRGIRALQIVDRSDSREDFRLELAAMDIDSMIEAEEENIAKPGQTRNLHLRTEYDNIFVKDIPKIRKWLLDKGAVFHKQMRDYISRFDKDMNPKRDDEAGAKVVISAFSHTIAPED